MIKEPTLFIELESIFAIGNYIVDYHLQVRDFFDWRKFNDLIRNTNDKFSICITYVNRDNYPNGLVLEIVEEVSNLLLSSTGKLQLFYAFRLQGVNIPYVDEYKVLNDVINVACNNNVLIDLSNSAIFVEDIYYFKSAKLLNINTVLPYESYSKLLGASVGIYANDDISGDIQRKHGYSSPSLWR